MLWSPRVTKWQQRGHGCLHAPYTGITRTADEPTVLTSGRRADLKAAARAVSAVAGLADRYAGDLGEKGLDRSARAWSSGRGHRQRAAGAADRYAPFVVLDDCIS